jgi:hypothetical protein
MGRGTRFATVLAMTAFVMLLGAGTASATFHLIKVREISPGVNGQDNSYVEVQMYAPLQQYLSPAKIVVCNDICSILPKEFTGFSTVANGNSQDTVLFGDSGVASKDFNVDLNLNAIESGGAVCYVSEPGYSDCVAWGNFNANSTLTTNYDSSANPGAPAPALSSGMALRRSIAPGCPSALEARDDTNNSAADFAVTTRNPRPNSVAPTEMPCGGSAPTGYPTTQPAPGTAKKKKKCRKHKRRPGSGNAGTAPSNTPAYAAKKKHCKKKHR